METPVVVSTAFGPPQGKLRHNFPKNFIFGASTSGFQIEGAVNEDGRGPSIWDTYARDEDLQGWQEATKHYDKYKEDVKAIKEMGLDAYRFSIAWSRVLPTGRESECVNEKGVEFYNNLLNELEAYGIQPFVTLFHWDLPQALEDEYGGFLSPKIVKDFQDYADFCFRKFGDRVKHWITFNGPWSLSYSGYGVGTIAPGRGSDAAEAEQFLEKHVFPSSRFLSRQCLKRVHSLCNGDPGREPYVVGKHQLVAHAAAVDLYRKKYQKIQKGVIGIVLQQIWPVAYSESKEDHEARARTLDFMLGWFMDPLAFGCYPKRMRELVGSRLPEFTVEESKLVKGSYDFIALNYYTANYTQHAPELVEGKPHVATDNRVRFLTHRDGVAIGDTAGSSWIHVYPNGILDFMIHMKERYNNPVIYISENGVDEVNDNELPLWESLSDHWRVSYYQRHLSFLRRAIQEHGVNVKGYFMWSLLDNFEWASALDSRFGNMFVDYKDGFKRYPKLSAHWLKFHLSHLVPVPPIIEL